MNSYLIWQQNSGEITNAENLQAIALWWSELAGQEVLWQQRLIAASGNFEDLDWQLQKFDQKIVLYQPKLKGISLFWCQDLQGDERNITASKMHLDLTAQKLYVIPQSQSQVVIAVSLPKVVYQQIHLVNPQVAATTKNGTGIILLRDDDAKLEIKISLDSQGLKILRDRLSGEERID